MSEKEKSRRNCYRKNREKWIFTQSVIIAVVTIAIVISSLVAYELNKTYYIGYTERGSVDYNVFLKENEFYDEPFIGKDQSYVASLIDNIVADFSYEIDMDTDDVNYKYSYTIKSRLEILDSKSDVPIFNPEYELVSVQNQSQSSSSTLRINEIVVLNYDQYNDLAEKFLHTYSLAGSTTSSIVVTMEVDVLSDCNAFSGSAVDTYKSELRIPLTTKTVNVAMKSAVPDDSAQMIACTRGAGFEAFRTTAIVLSVVDGLLILLLAAFIYLTRTEDITYTARVKKILSQYKSYIQKINNLFDASGYQIIYVDRFDEMLEIRDTIQAPILMHENADKTCTKFLIPTDSKLLYVYAISIEGYVEPELPKKEEPAPTTVVEPQITNVVRPVVKVVVTPPTPPTPTPDPAPAVTTVMEEPEVEIEAEPDEIPTVDVTLTEEAEEITEVEEIAEVAEIEEVREETDSEVEELIASIPEVEEECVPNGVDAIDVCWKEREGKTYRYDPDGNKVEAGDVVLVPTRDVESDKEIVREAEVARGNYQVDATTLEHPLKKIIGVVRRRAEKVFTAMITPDENKNN